MLTATKISALDKKRRHCRNREYQPRVVPFVLGATESNFTQYRTVTRSFRDRGVVVRLIEPLNKGIYK